MIKNFTVIPAIDIIEGKCVRLIQGDFSQKKVYNEDPLEVAKQFEAAGMTRLHLVDLDGARTGSVKNWKVLESIAGRTKLIIDFGGGIKTEKDVLIVFNSGAAMAAVGSIAIQDEKEFIGWLNKFHHNRFLLGADVKEEKVTISGWQETTAVSVYDFIDRFKKHGVEQFFCTDVAKDGELKGPAIELYKKLLEKFADLQLIASGGVGRMNDIFELAEIGCAGVIVGKAIYENKISLKDLSGLIKI